MCYNYFNGEGGISFDAPFPLLYESAKKLTSTSRSYQLLIDAHAEQDLSLTVCCRRIRPKRIPTMHPNQVNETITILASQLNSSTTCVWSRLQWPERMSMSRVVVWFCGKNRSISDILINEWSKVNRTIKNTFPPYLSGTLYALHFLNTLEHTVNVHTTQSNVV